MDNRVNNGNKGHSTKSEGVDKRKNEYRKALEMAGGVDEVIEVLKTVYKKATLNSDMKAAQLYLEYYLGKPKQDIDINSSEGFSINFKELVKFGND